MEKRDFLQTGKGVFLSAIFANFLWGSASSCIKLGYKLFQIASEDVMSQLLFAGMRFTIAGIFTILFRSLVTHRLPVPGKGSAGMLVTLALTQTIIQYSLNYMGLANAPGFKGSVIGASSAFFAVLISALLFRMEKLTARKILGCLIGFLGVVAIHIHKAGQDAGFRWNGEGFLLVGSISYALSSVLLKTFSSREDPVVLSGYQFILGGLVLLAIGAIRGGSLKPTTPAAWLLLFYLICVTAVAYTIWALLLERHPVSRIAVFSFFNPVFGVFLSALILGEGKQLHWGFCLLSLLLVSIGIWIVNRKKT